MSKLKSRLTKLEKATMPYQFPRYVQTFSDQQGINGEMIRRETDEQAIQRHLTTHPEDVGAKFEIINRVFVSPDGQHGGGNV